MMEKWSWASLLRQGVVTQAYLNLIVVAEDGFELLILRILLPSTIELHDCATSHPAPSFSVLSKEHRTTWLYAEQESLIH